MKVSMKWLKQYADIPVTPAEYESRMVMTGTGVEGTWPLGEIDNVVVGKVLTCRVRVKMEGKNAVAVPAGYTGWKRHLTAGLKAKRRSMTCCLAITAQRL